MKFACTISLFVLDRHLYLDTVKFRIHRMRKAEGSADETHRVEAASSNPLVESPPRSCAHWETMPG